MFLTVWGVADPVIGHRSHRIRLLLLIASSAADWFVAKDLIERADVQFRMEKTVRRRPDGEEDCIIRELREELAAVKEQHEAEQPRDEDFEAMEDLDEAMEEARLEEEEFADEDDFAGEKDEFADSTGNIVRERDEVAGEVDKSVPKDELVGGEAEAVVRDYPEDKSADTARGRQDDSDKVEEQVSIGTFYAYMRGNLDY